MIVGLTIAAVLIGYLLGSIPCGLLIGRMFAKTDVRNIGSGKTGMTNVMRAAGKKAAAVALLLDLGKGALAVIIAGLVMGDYHPHVAQALAAAAAVGGHTWSIFLKFRGGRGVATFIGSMLALWWPAAVFGGIFIMGIGFQTKYMSLGSIIGAVIAFILTMSFHILQVTVFGPYPPLEYVVYTMVGAIFISVMHRDNIARLMNGTERRIGDKNAARPTPSSTTYK